MKAIMMISAIYLALLESPLAAGNVVSALGLEWDPAFREAAVSETVHSLLADGAPLNFLLKGEKEAHELIIKELHTLPTTLLQTPEFQKILSLMIKEGTWGTIRIAIIRELGKIPAEEWKRGLINVALLPFIEDVQWYNQLKIIRTFVEIPAEKQEDFAHAVGPLVQDKYTSFKVIKKFAKVPAEEWKTLSAIVLPFIKGVDWHWSGWLKIIRTFVKIPAEKREDFANAVRPLVQEPDDERAAIIEEFAKVPAEQLETLSAVVLPFIEDGLWFFAKIIRTFASLPAEQWETLSAVVRPFIEDGLLFYGEIIHTFASLPAEKREDFAHAVGPLVQDKYASSKVIKKFASLPAEEWKTLSAVVLPFIEDRPLFYEEIIHTFASLPAEKREDFAHAVRPLVKGRYGRITIIKEFAKVPAEKWEMFVNTVSPLVAGMKWGHRKVALICALAKTPEEKWGSFVKVARTVLHAIDVDECPSDTEICYDPENNRLTTKFMSNVRSLVSAGAGVPREETAAVILPSRVDPDPEEQETAGLRPGLGHSSDDDEDPQ